MAHLTYGHIRSAEPAVLGAGRLPLSPFPAPEPLASAPATAGFEEAMVPWFLSGYGEEGAVYGWGMRRTATVHVHGGPCEALRSQEFKSTESLRMHKNKVRYNIFSFWWTILGQISRVIFRQTIAMCSDYFNTSVDSAIPLIMLRKKIILLALTWHYEVIMIPLLAFCA